MKTLCRMRVDLTAEERNLMSIAFKNWVGLRRSSLRTLIDVEKKETGMASPWLVDHIKSYRQKVENEFVQLCNEVISIINDFLIPSTESPEIKAFYHKMYAF
jgi:14-3-3 protein epsilon